MFALVYSPTLPLPPNCNLITFVYGCTTKSQIKRYYFWYWFKNKNKRLQVIYELEFYNKDIHALYE